MDLNNLNFDLVTIQAFTLIFFRVGSILWLAPIFGSDTLPGVLKVGFALVVTFMVYPLVNTNNFLFLEGTLDYVLAVAREFAIGVIIGYVSIMLFSGIRLSGQLIGRQMGFAIANVIDPLSKQQISVMAHLNYFTALLLFLACNMHHFFLRAILKTFEVVPLMGLNPGNLLAENLIKITSQVFVIAVKLGAPGIAMLLVISAAMGIISKTVPQLNILIAGLPVRVAAGLVGVAVGLPLYTYIMQGLFYKMVRNLEVIIYCLA